MLTVMNYLNRIRGVTGGDISPAAHAPVHFAILEALLRVNLDVEGREGVEAQLSQSTVEASVRQFLLKSLARDRHGRFYWRWSLPFLLRDYPKMTGPIEGPPYPDSTFFLRRSLSSYLPESHLPRAPFPAGSDHNYPQSWPLDTHRQPTRSQRSNPRILAAPMRELSSSQKDISLPLIAERSPKVEREDALLPYCPRLPEIFRLSFAPSGLPFSTSHKCKKFPFIKEYFPSDMSLVISTKLHSTI